MQKKIVHVGNTAGIPTILARELRKLGYDAYQYSTESNSFFEGNKISKYLLYLKLLSAGIVHFHGRWKPLPIGVKANKVVFHYHGDDLRHFRNWVPHKEGVLHLVSTPDLACGGYFFDKKPCDCAETKLRLFPNPVEIEIFKPSDTETEKVPVIIHSPQRSTQIQAMGTSRIREYIKQIESEGYSFRYSEFTNVAHSQIPGIFSTSDIIIDRVDPGFHGVTALEGIAMGKAVVTDIRWGMEWENNEDLFFKLSDIPRLLTDKKFRNSRRQQGIDYVRKYHSPEVVAKRLLKEYESAGLLD